MIKKKAAVIFINWIKNEQGYMPENSNLEQEAGQ
jgi:glyceraldehyde-3-phosphate dehydrogenase/erythrose-4-phosphate dehydrogenase